MREKQPSERTFSFRFVTDKECHDALRHLKVSKPQGTSSTPAWALKELVPHLSFIITHFIKEQSFQKSLTKAIVMPLFKKGDTEVKNSVYGSVIITNSCDHSYSVSSPKFFCPLSSIDQKKSFPVSIEKENSKNFLLPE